MVDDPTPMPVTLRGVDWIISKTGDALVLWEARCEKLKLLVTANRFEDLLKVMRDTQEVHIRAKRIRRYAKNQ